MEIVSKFVAYNSVNYNLNDIIFILIVTVIKVILSISFQEGGVKRTGRKQAKGEFFHMVFIGLLHNSP